MTAQLPDAESETFCGHCGGQIAGGVVHEACARKYPLDPPRFCYQCKRRMKVRITPAGWQAECSRHGLVTP